MKKKSKTKRFSSEHSDIILSGILLFMVIAIEITMLFFNRMFFLNFFGVMNDIFIYFCFIVLINFIKHVRARKIAFTIFLTVFALLFLIDALYSAFFGGFTSIDSLKTVGNLFIKKDVGIYVPLAGIIIALEWAAGIFLIWFIKIKKVRENRFYRYALAVFLATVIGISSVNVAVIASTRNKEYETKIEYYASNAFLYDYFYNSYRYTTTYGYLNYRIRDFSYSDNSNIIIDDIKDYYSDIYDVPRNQELSGIFEGYNLITVLCETFDTRIADKQLMPNFSAVMENSLIFENYYVPTFFEAPTINSEYMSLNGRFPISAKAWVSSMGDHYKHNDFSDFSTPGQLKNFGYKTYYMHEGYRSFYSRETLMPNMGFDETYFIEDLPYSSNEYDTELIDLMDNIDFSEKFYLSMLTYSMHKGNDSDFTPKKSSDPIYKDYSFVTQNYPQLSKDTQIYFTKARVFDNFVGMLFEKLVQEGAIDNTIVLFYPDHYAYGNKNVLTDLSLDANSKEIHHQMLTMYIPEEPRADLLSHIPHNSYKDYDTARSTPLLGATIDLSPTLLNLFTKGSVFKYFSGQDIFAGDNYIFFSDYTVFDGEAFYDLEQNLYSYNGLSQSELEARLPSLISRLENYVEITIMHRIMLDIDYFKRIKEEIQTD